MGTAGANGAFQISIMVAAIEAPTCRLLCNWPDTANYSLDPF